MARTDIHRPSQIQTDAYILIGFKYVGPSDFGGIGDDRFAIAQHLKQTGGRYSHHDHGGTCGVCGAYAHTLGVFWHEATNTYINAGEDCSYKLDAGEDIAFRAFKKRVAAGLETARGKLRAQKVLADNGLQAAWDIAQGTVDGWEENTIRDIVGKLVQYGDLSGKQVGFISKLLAKILTRDAEKAAHLAANAGSQHVGTVGKREKFALSIDWVKGYDSTFGTMYINGLRDLAGNIVIYSGSKALGEKGQQIIVLATVKAHGEREGVKQTVISRPAHCAA